MNIAVPTAPVIVVPLTDIDAAASAAIWPRHDYDAGTLAHLTALVEDARDRGGNGAALDALDPIYVAEAAGLGYVVSDGQHRAEAHRRADLSQIKAIILPSGTDAYLFALQQARNAATKLTGEDTRRNILALADDTDRKLTQAQIAALVGVTQGRVSQVLNGKVLATNTSGVDGSGTNEYTPNPFARQASAPWTKQTAKDLKTLEACDNGMCALLLEKKALTAEEMGGRYRAAIKTASEEQRSHLLRNLRWFALVFNYATET